MFGVSRRVSAAIGAAATILVLSTSAVAAADPDSATARANGSPAGVPATLGIKSDHAAPSRPHLDHGGGLQPPATDVEATPLRAGAPASGVGVALALWFLVFAGGVLASLKYMTRRARL